MYLGERAKIRISPEYAYGKEGYSDIIPPDSTLVFDVFLFHVVGTA